MPKLQTKCAHVHLLDTRGTRTQLNNVYTLIFNSRRAVTYASHLCIELPGIPRASSPAHHLPGAATSPKGMLESADTALLPGTSKLSIEELWAVSHAITISLAIQNLTNYKVCNVTICLVLLLALLSVLLSLLT
ncbi:hypothetical protein Hamer_G005620 [Homarus americanus]|uniref:Uncharacterized protein n=1 Tax=Homarus americanus TaxID=6706 RepID=A0A8J5MWJ9_HOMAM|nr:hypothetical protein Hamer_G005620 [Homarus americanus]